MRPVLQVGIRRVLEIIRAIPDDPRDIDGAAHHKLADLLLSQSLDLVTDYGWGIPIAASLVILVSVSVIRKRPEYLWAAIIGTAFAGPILTFAVPALWRTPAAGFVFLSGLGTMFLLVAPVVTVFIGGVQSLGIVAYLAATAQFREPNERLSAYLSSSWKRCGFGWWTKRAETWLPSASCLAIGLFALLGSRWPVVTSVVGYALQAILVAGVVAAGICLIWALGTGLRGATRFFRDHANRRATSAAVLRFMKGLAEQHPQKVFWTVACCLLLGLALWITPSFEVSFESKVSFILSAAKYLGRPLAMIVAAWLVGFLVVQATGTSRWLVNFRRRPFPPLSYTESTWKELLSPASASLQEEIMLRTNPKSLGLDSQQFLGVLREAQPLIKGEPALSAYWAHRAELEQVLKQERQD